MNIDYFKFRRHPKEDKDDKPVDIDSECVDQMLFFFSGVTVGIAICIVFYIMYTTL